MDVIVVNVDEDVDVNASYLMYFDAYGDSACLSHQEDLVQCPFQHPMMNHLI